MGIDQIRKNFVKSMSVKKFSYLGQFIQGLRTPDDIPENTLKTQIYNVHFITIVQIN